MPQNLQDLNKECRKCKNTFPANVEFFYKNAGGKFGLTPRCKSCVNEDNRISHQKRLAINPEKVRTQATNRTKKHYHNNLDISRKRARASAAKARQDPIKYEKIQARKRAGGAGLTPQEIDAIRIKQNNQCAICETPYPTDLDHCHTSGKVRWLLCKHCNRGLGAFTDSPRLLRKAAELLEQYQNQGNKPTKAIFLT